MNKNDKMFTISFFIQLNLGLTVSPHVLKSHSVAALDAKMTDVNGLSCYSHIAAIPRNFPMAGATYRCISHLGLAVFVALQPKVLQSGDDTIALPWDLTT